MVDLSLDEIAGRVLIDAAREAARHAHAPYSRFAVGAALLLTDGSTIAGANFENASYGLSLCAETVAVATASAQGRLGEIVAIGVIGGMIGADRRPLGVQRGAPLRPLPPGAKRGGADRGRDLLVHCGAAEGEAIEHHRLSALLPHAFGPADLGLG